MDHTEASRPDDDDIVRLLMNCDLIIDRESAVAIGPELKWRILPGGKELFHEGDQGSSLFIVASGRLRILKGSTDGEAKVLGELGATDVVGEMSLLTRRPRSATALAIRDTELLEFSYDDLHSLLGRSPHVAWTMAQILATRVNSSSDQTTETSGSCRIWTILGVDGTSPGDVLKLLEPALALSDETIALLRRSDIEDKFGPWPVEGEHPRNLELVRWLNSLERSHSLIVQVADPNAPGWCRRCARQSDRIVLVADAGGNPGSSGLEQKVLEANPNATRSLVLLHPPGVDTPKTSKQWVSRRPRFSVHHVRRGRASDIARVGRLFLGKARGLVLSGGGARSFAQIGAVRAIQEAGVEIDMYAGTSMGAIIAAMAADGWEAKRILEGNRKAWIHNRPTWELNLPLASMLGDKGLAKQAGEWFEGRWVEDLMFPYFCMSTNLSRRQETMRDSGDLWTALRASAAIPGVVAPHVENGEVHVDGGVLNNLPIDEMRRRTPFGQVFAVDVYKRHGMRVDPSLTRYPSGLELLWQAAPWTQAPHVPLLSDIVEICATIGSARLDELNESLADLIVRPPVEDYGVLQFRAIDRLEQIGYETTRKALEQFL